MVDVPVSSADDPPRRVPDSLVGLVAHRWNVPVLAHLHADGETTFGVLVQQLGASRDGLARSLGALSTPGLVTRGTGRRGSYRIAPAGTSLGPPCASIVRAPEIADVHDLAFRKWTLPVIAALRGWEVRFAELRALLPGISPRALTLALKDMQAAGLVARTVIGGFPPATSYRLTEAALALADPVDRLRTACAAARP